MWRKIAQTLKMTPHPEGGYYAETYRSDESLSAESLPARYGSPRPFSTAICYLLAPGDIARIHRIKSDEIFHFYAGSPVELLILLPGGTGRVEILGNDVENGQRPQIVIPMNAWQGGRVRDGGWALMGTTVAPGFEYTDWELAARADLLKSYPGYAGIIAKLTR
jgi:predicted cupin superfamily sugar epimerase